MKRQEEIDPEACKKTKKICYPKSLIFRLTRRSMTPAGSGPTPDDLRIAACVHRTLSGTTFEDFKSLNIAVGKFLLKNGGVDYIPKANLPGEDIHSEDEILREAEKRYGVGNFKLAALFSERVPCRRCKGFLKKFPLTDDCKVYSITNVIRSPESAEIIRDNYNNGVLF